MQLFKLQTLSELYTGLY